MVKIKNRTKKVCRICHAEVFQGDKARICKQQVTGSKIMRNEIVIFCPNCKRELNLNEVTTKRRHKGMPRGKWVFDD